MAVLLRFRSLGNTRTLVKGIMGPVLFMLVGLGCSTKDLLDDLDPYQGEWLLPLVYSDLSLDEVGDVERFTREAEVSADDLELPSGTPGSVPAFVIPLLGPYPMEVASYIHEVQAQLAALELKVTNGLPITLSPGTMVELRNSPDPNNPSNLLFSVELDTELEPGDIFLTSTTNTAFSFYETMYVFLRNVGSPGAQDVDATGAFLNVEITVDIQRVDLVRVHTNEQWTLRDSFAVDLSGELDNNTDAATGHLIVYGDNGLPVQGTVQLYLYDAVGAQIDSLFDTPFVLGGGQTNADGQTTTVTTTVDSVAVNSTRLERWRNGRSASVLFAVNTNGYPGPFVTADPFANLRLQVVGDLQLNIAYSSFE